MMNIESIRVRAKKRLRFEEDLRLFVYRCTSGKLTIGYGRNLEGQGITQAEAEYLLDNDVMRCMASLRSSLSWFVDLDETRQVVLVDMAHQLGVRGLLGFKKMIAAVPAAMQTGDWELVRQEMLDSNWAKIDTPNRAQTLSQLMLYGDSGGSNAIQP